MSGWAFSISSKSNTQLAPREHLAHAWLAWEEAARRCFSPSNADAIRILAKRLGWKASTGEAGETP